MIRRCGRWCRTHARILVPYLLVVLAACAGLVGLQREAHQRCVDRQNDRQVLRQVVVISTSSSGSRDLTKVQGFDQLDEFMQQYLRNLSQQVTGSSPAARQTLQQQLLDQLPPIHC